MSRSPAAKALRAGFPVTLRARGGSMWPMLRTGQWVTIEPAPVARLRRDDIAVFETEHGLVAHRIVSVDPCITRGDRCSANDVIADPAAIVGCVRSIRFGGVDVDVRGAIGRSWSRLCACVSAGGL